MTQGCMNWAPNEIQIHLREFASLPFQPLHYPKLPFFYESIFIRKVEVILRRPAAENSKIVLSDVLNWWTLNRDIIKKTTPIKIWKSVLNITCICVYTSIYVSVCVSERDRQSDSLLGLIWFYGISTILGYLMPNLFLYIYHRHHHVMPLARISLTLSRHFSLSFITSGRSSGLHLVSSHSCCMYVRARCPAFARPYVGVHRSTSLMSSSLLFQQYPACLVRLTWIVFVIGGRWPYSWCLVGCCHQVLFNIALNILV